MHKNIFSEEQLQMLPTVKKFSSLFYLVGGTALALQLGHRRSIDFDLFTPDFFDNQFVRNTINATYQISQVLIETKDEFTFVSNGVRFTFYHYPYDIAHQVKFDDVIAMPDQLTIAAMKAFALGRRAKWKDYVDLFFVFQNFSLKDLILKATVIFGEGEFNEKLFREQLAYYDDVSYTEKIDFLPGFEVSDEKIKDFLKKISLQN